MEPSRYLAHLEADYRRLGEVVAPALDAPVPSCPEWTGADLVRHVAEVYLHKAEIMRRGTWPEPWPPDLTGEPPLTALDRGYAELTAELAARPVTQPSVTWFDPDQTVGFWLRRMAQETVIHRVDAELTAGIATASTKPIPEDLAEDGIDEVLVRFLAYDSVQCADELGELLTSGDGRTLLVDSGSRSWLVQLGPDQVTVSASSADKSDTDAVVGGDAAAVLRWLWRRGGDDEVTLHGTWRALETLRRLMAEVTQ